MRQALRSEMGQASGRDAILGILFDKDGTLLDFDESWGHVNRRVAMIASAGDMVLADRMLLACGMDPLTGDIRPDSLFAAANTREIGAALVDIGSPIEFEALVEALDELFAQASEQSVPVADLASLFGSLKEAGFAIGIASSDNERSIRRIVERFGLAWHVDYVAGYDSGYGAKPGPGMVEGFCRATGLAPAQIAVVGDSNHDMHMGAAAGAGLKIAVLSGTGSRTTLEAAADCCLNDITELLPFLR